MGILKNFLDGLNSITGINSRHNKALREINDWTGSVQRFLTTYDLYGGPGFDPLLENIGEAKFDLTAIIHRARPLIGAAKNIKGKQVLELILELNDRIESLRRTLINPVLQEEKLGEGILGLRVSFEKLRDALSEIGYL